MCTNGWVERKVVVLKNQLKTSQKGGALKKNNLSRRRESLCLSSYGALKVHLISLTRQKQLHSTLWPRVKCDIRCSKWQRSIRCLNTVILVSAGRVTVKKVQLFSLMAIMCRGIMDWPAGQQDISKRRSPSRDTVWVSSVRTLSKLRHLKGIISYSTQVELKVLTLDIFYCVFNCLQPEKPLHECCTNNFCVHGWSSLYGWSVECLNNVSTILRQHPFPLSQNFYSTSTWKLLSNS